MTTVLLVDDQDMVRSGFRLILSAADPAVHIVGEAGNGADGVAQARALRPDVVVMDIRMPGMDGIEATRRRRAAVPEVAVLVLTMFEDDETVFGAMRAGAPWLGRMRVKGSRASRSNSRRWSDSRSGSVT